MTETCEQEHTTYAHCYLVSDDRVTKPYYDKTYKHDTTYYAHIATLLMIRTYDTAFKFIR